MPEDNIPSYLPDWVKKIIQWGDSYLIVTIYVVMAFVPLILAAGMVWMAKGFWDVLRGKKGEDT